MKQIIEIGGRECLLYSEGEQHPQVLLVQTLGEQERGSIDSEVAMIRGEITGTSFMMAAFAVGDWEAELTPWHDPAVSKRQAVGEHAFDTLDYVTQSLIPYLKEQFGNLPVILGGYSLGGLFSRWAASKTECFEAVAAVSPSLWIDAWCSFSDAHAVYAHYVYLSLGDREEHSRNKAIAQVLPHFTEVKYNEAATQTATTAANAPMIIFVGRFTAAPLPTDCSAATAEIRATSQAMRTPPQMRDILPIRARTRGCATSGRTRAPEPEGRQRRKEQERNPAESRLSAKREGEVHHVRERHHDEVKEKKPPDAGIEPRQQNDGRYHRAKPRHDNSPDAQNVPRAGIRRSLQRCVIFNRHTSPFLISLSRFDFCQVLYHIPRQMRRAAPHGQGPPQPERYYIIANGIKPMPIITVRYLHAVLRINQVCG